MAIKVAVNSRFLTQRVTGVQRYARELTGEIICLLGPENVALLAPEDAPADFRGVKVRRCGGIIKGHAWEQFVLPKAFKDSGAGLLWCPCNTGPIFADPLVITIHDVAVFAMPQGYNPIFVRWYRLILPRLAHTSQCVITVSSFSKREIIEYLNIGSDKVAVVYNGVSDYYAALAEERVVQYRKEKSLPKRFILGIASKSPNKNLKGLLRAWELLCSQNALEDVWLVIAGGFHNSFQGDLKNMEPTNYQRVIDLNYVSDEELPLLYNAAEAFVFPSFYEGFGLPLLEAMACGTPVIVSNAASMPEIVGEAGVYVNPFDPEDIAKAILLVLTEKDLQQQKMRVKGLAQAGLFSWKKAAGRLLEIFDKVTESGGMKGV